MDRNNDKIITTFKKFERMPGFENLWRIKTEHGWFDIKSDLVIYKLYSISKNTLVHLSLNDNIVTNIMIVPNDMKWNRESDDNSCDCIFPCFIKEKLKIL